MHATYLGLIETKTKKEGMFEVCVFVKGSRGGCCPPAAEEFGCLTKSAFPLI